MRTRMIFLFLILLLSSPLVAKASGTVDYAESVDPAVLRKAVKDLPSHPDDEQTFYLACQCYLASKSIHNVDRLAHRYLKTHPEWASVHFVLGRAAQAVLDDDEAMRYLKQAVKMQPRWIKASWIYAGVLEQNGLHQESIDVINSALTYLHGDDLVTRNWKHSLFEVKAPALKNLGRYKEAERILNEDLSLRGVCEREKVVDSLTELYVEDKQWTQAIKLATQRLSQDKNDIRAYLSRAKAYAGAGRYEPALKDLDAYVKLETSGPSIKKEVLIHYLHDAMTLKAEIYDKMGRKDLAAKERALMEKQSNEIYDAAIFRGKDPTK